MENDCRHATFPKLRHNHPCLDPITGLKNLTIPIIFLAFRDVLGRGQHKILYYYVMIPRIWLSRGMSELQRRQEVPQVERQRIEPSRFSNLVVKSIWSCKC